MLLNPMRGIFDLRPGLVTFIISFSGMPPIVKVAESMELLAGSWPNLLAGILEGRFAFWLGSGISRDRFPNVEELLKLTLKGIYGRITSSDPNCPYLKSLERIIALTTVTGLVLTDEPETWPADKRNEVLKQLQGRYSDVLDQDIRIGHTAIPVRWEILKLETIYGDSTVIPDAEHRFLAFLTEEGILREIVTTNWDALIEKASSEARLGRTQNLQSVAANDEWSRDGYTARLVKIHGCASKSCGNPTKYKPFLVATRNELQRWQHDPQFGPFRDNFRTTLRDHTALFIGLSAQDWNIQSECCATVLKQGGFFPTSPQKVYFAEQRVENSQRAVLKAIYGEAAYNSDAENIDAKAAVPLFAKPLLGSLFAFTLIRKLELLQDLDNPDLVSAPRKPCLSTFL